MKLFCIIRTEEVFFISTPRFIRGRDHLATKIGSNLEITARGASKRDPLYGDKSCEEVRNSRDVLETGILIKTPPIQSKNRIRPHTFQ